ncbi:3'-5' exoribonuclease csl4-related [Anaeramoeba ignava]|uniref:3'-5' exoribonuclease csl4-related n=1 Tax=Anaeramoeba ignava TaxID=1746090 RepID=A0A9Q0LRG7_ANAIG|nr:3'-5' exoribonuclease csl4-related [Anaeramoeba ignava]
MNKKIIIPGERIGKASEYESGKGTYINNNYIYSSQLGKIKIESKQTGKKIIEIENKQETAISKIPKIGDKVTCKVIKINPRLIKVHIYCVEEKQLNEPFFGIILTHDIKSTEIDKIKVENCFKPNDVILAEVISLGESRSFSYYLSTAKDDLGVILSINSDGFFLFPYSDSEMICHENQSKEKRKVAILKK